MDTLKYLRAQATVLQTVTLLQCQYDSLKVRASIERVQQLHDRFPDDLILSRCLVKTLTTMGRVEGSEGYFTPFVMK